MTLEPQRVRARAFPQATWLITYHPIELGNLRGEVILIDIWDFT